ncbi:hypothetical protein HPB50_017455 [Hyalomma asiaticum]|uniref:Uncharacterized protein n=1 Tax=Hyalomma asiaticum TaxID=266040 RepID=A0ACB7RLG7_HYAAI|nr:hypothetical protein HPB50_017455 [Hyalomma asiaticum]
MRGAVGGVNWRPTRFVAVNLHPYVCSLCGVISGKTLLLPCAHSLCETCTRGSFEDGTAASCPLDSEAFDEDDCTRITLPARKVNALRAHCWNEDMGCQFVDTLPAVLKHYEEECAFHFVQCPRCGASVQHAALVAHYKAGCHDGTKGPNHGEMLQAGRTSGPMDVSAAVNEFKSLIKNHYQDQLPALESKMNEITEQMMKHGELLKEMSRTLRVTQDTPREHTFHRINLKHDCDGRNLKHVLRGGVLELILWHLKDVYFTVAIDVRESEDTLEVRLRLAGTLETSSLEYDVLSVFLWDKERKMNCLLKRTDEAAFNAEPTVWQHVFWHRYSDLKKRGFFDGGELDFILDVVG